MIEIKVFDGECIAKIPDGYMEDFMAICVEYQTANITFYHLSRCEAGRHFKIKIAVPFGDYQPFITHCRHRHNIKFI